MDTALVLDIVVKSTVVLVGAMVAVRCMRGASAAARHAVWTGALFAVLMMPVLAALVPAWRVLPRWGGVEAKKDIRPAVVVTAAPVEQVNRVSSSEAGVVGREARPTVVRAVESSRLAAPASIEQQAAGTSLWRVMASIYAAGAVSAMLPVLAGVAALLRLERKSRQISQGTWAGLVQDVREVLGIRREVLLLKSGDDGVMPMTWGIARPRVLVPGSAERWSAERRRMVLLHEGAHIKRGDALTQLLGHLVCCAYWFHPLAWYAKSRARLEAEHACDDMVMATRGACGSVKASAYASELLTMAGVFRASMMHSGVAIAMARGSGGQLQSRIRAILDTARNRRGLSIRRVVVCAIAAMGIVASLAALRAADVAGEKGNDFSRVVHFEIGYSQFLPGDSITISEVRGGIDAVAVGNTYQIKGTYTLASAGEADLAAYVTALTRDDTHHDPYDKRQTVHIKKGTGNFTVVLPFLSKGHPHLSFYPMDGGQSFSAIYFGTGETVEPKRPPTVTVLVSPAGISFEGKGTTWDELPGLLERVPDRGNTILAMALTTDQMTVKVRNEAFGKLADFTKKFGFRYLSDTGIQVVKQEAATEPAMREKLHSETARDAGKSEEDAFDPANFPPVVVKTVPESGELNVSSKVTELSATFSKDMVDGNYAWCQFSEESFPKTTGEAHFVNARTCVLPVKLEPHHHYAIGLNTPPYDSFQDAGNRKAVYYVLAFDTGD